MRVNNWHLVIGGVLSLMGAFLAIVLKEEPASLFVFFLANFTLFWYTIATIEEFCRNLLQTTEENPTE